MQSAPRSPRTEAFGRAPPRLDPAATKSRTSASMSVAARSASSSSWSTLTSRGTPWFDGASARKPSGPQMRTAPWRVSSPTPASMSHSKSERAALRSRRASFRSARISRFLPQRSGMQSSNARRSRSPSEWKLPRESGISGERAKAPGCAR